MESFVGAIIDFLVEEKTLVGIFSVAIFFEALKYFKIHRDNDEDLKMYISLLFVILTFPLMAITILKLLFWITVILFDLGLF